MFLSIVFLLAHMWNKNINIRITAIENVHIYIDVHGELKKRRILFISVKWNKWDISVGVRVLQSMDLYIPIQYVHLGLSTLKLRVRFAIMVQCTQFTL